MRPFLCGECSVCLTDADDWLEHVRQHDVVCKFLTAYCELCDRPVQLINTNNKRVNLDAFILHVYERCPARPPDANLYRKLIVQ